LLVRDLFAQDVGVPLGGIADPAACQERPAGQARRHLPARLIQQQFSGLFG
jgi:hypothetical protein